MPLHLRLLEITTEMGMIKLKISRKTADSALKLISFCPHLIGLSDSDDCVVNGSGGWSEIVFFCSFLVKSPDQRLRDDMKNPWWWNGCGGAWWLMLMMDRRSGGSRDDLFKSTRQLLYASTYASHPLLERISLLLFSFLVRRVCVLIIWIVILVARHCHYWRNDSKGYSKRKLVGGLCGILWL